MGQVGLTHPAHPFFLQCNMRAAALVHHQVSAFEVFAMERLQKILSQAGIASRRASEQLMLDGRVSVNGATVRELGTKADPFALHTEVPPRQASVVWELDYEWGDGEWMAGREERQSLAAPMSIYEVHLGSWRRVPEEGNRSLTYREIASRLGARFRHGEELHHAADRAAACNRTNRHASAPPSA